MKKQLLSLSLFFFALTAISAQKVKVTSPDRKISVEITAGEKLQYSVVYNGKTVLLPSILGFQFTNEPELSGDIRIIDSTRKTINEKWTPIVSKHKEITDHCNEVELKLQEKRFPRRNLTVFFRVYNDGMAFRYFLPMQHGFANREITRELSSFRFAENHEAWMAHHGSYTTSQETEYRQGNIAGLNEGSIIGLPFLVKVKDICYAAITEANIEDWAGFYIGRIDAAGAGVTLSTKLSPLPRQSENGVKVKISSDHFSPWRVILLGKEPGRLVESEIVMNLNDPCAIEDVSWIKPGKCAWDHWWSGEVKMDTETLKKYIQFASDMGFPYQLIDWQWYGPFNQPDADITKVNPAVDMPEVLRFAKEKNVRCWLWLYNTDAERQYKEAFALYEKWGIAGIKIDFMDRDDKEMVNWYHKIVKAAADHHLLVNFHGAYKPDGMQRTYPNFMTREGVMGNEYAKWSTRVTPEHNITLAFTRMLAGPMDYTPGGFLNRTPETFRTGTPANVMNTRCHELAKFVVFDSPIMTVCDHPDHYYNQPGIEFLKAVPVKWDDTRIPAGEVGKFIISARKSGNDWFIGILNNSETREFSLKLDFLENAQYEATTYADAPDASVNAEKLIKDTIPVNKSTVIRIKMAPGGGYAAQLRKL